MVKFGCIGVKDAGRNASAMAKNTTGTPRLSIASVTINRLKIGIRKMADIRVCSHGQTDPCDQCAEERMNALSVSGAIVGAAQAEHRQLKDAVVRAAKLWLSSKGEPLARQMLEDAVNALFSFEQRNKNILALGSDAESKTGHIGAKWIGTTLDGERYTPE